MLTPALEQEIHALFEADALAAEEAKQQKRAAEDAHMFAQLERLRTRFVADWPEDLRAAFDPKAVTRWSHPQEAVVLTIDGQEWLAWLWGGRDWKVDLPDSGASCPLGTGPQLRTRMLLAVAQYRRDRAQQEAVQRHLETTLAAARATLWRWPAGRALVLYHWNWCIAPAADATSAAYDSGWSPQPRLDADGWLQLPPERGPYRESPSRAPRYLRISPESLAVIGRHAFRSLEDLPRCLRELVTTTVTGMVERDEDDRPLAHDVGEQPLPWVRRLLDEDSAPGQDPSISAYQLHIVSENPYA